ncbi:hypothetical protein SARC_08044, partial [Sphaeroforma arctica JP610]
EQVLLEALEPYTLTFLGNALTVAPPNTFLLGVVEVLGVHEGQEAAVRIMARVFLSATTTPGIIPSACEEESPLDDGDAINRTRRSEPNEAISLEDDKSINRNGRSHGTCNSCEWATFRRFLRLYSNCYPAQQALPDVINDADHAMFVHPGEDIMAHLTRHLLQDLRKYSAAQSSQLIGHLLKVYFPEKTPFSTPGCHDNANGALPHSYPLPTVLRDHWWALFRHVTSYPQDPELLKLGAVLLSFIPVHDADVIGSTVSE